MFGLERPPLYSSLLLTGAGAAGEAAFSPLDIAGLELWLDGSDAGTMYDATSGGSLVVDGGAVARWEDKSGNANHVTQSTSNNRPLRVAGDGLEFDGVNDFLTGSSILDGLDNATLFVVANAATLGEYQSCVREQDLNYFSFPWGAGATLISSADQGIVGPNPCFTAGQKCIGTAMRTRNSLTGLRAWLDGVAVANTQATNDAPIGGAASFAIGAHPNGTENFTGVISHVLIYAAALTDQEREAVEAYLAAL